ncbi:MAG: alcohol dehydrogenase catalytic domain-containing protein, partial [Boseongicola sp.]|nr:alcohol dehydrogenase catalytic domain-containing protein [Boseongicola sp.]
MEFLTVSAPNSPPTLTIGANPSPDESQVQIRVAATALNYADLLMIEGRYQDTPPFPLTPGLEIAGTVTAIGKDVSTLQVGDRIAAITGHGGLAEYATIDADRALSLPDTIDFPTAAAFQITYA